MKNIEKRNLNKGLDIILINLFPARVALLSNALLGGFMMTDGKFKIKICKKDGNVASCRTFSLKYFQFIMSSHYVTLYVS